MTSKEQKLDDGLPKNFSERVSITFGVKPELWKELQKAASEEQCQIGEYLESLLQQIVFNEGSEARRKPRPISQEAIDRLLQLREEIMRTIMDNLLKIRFRSSGRCARSEQSS